MKKLFLFSILSLSCAAMFSCNEMADNDGKTTIVHDSMNNVLPNWQALKIKVDDNHTRMTVIVGDLSFYAASPEEKAKKAEELGKMILRIYGKGNYLEKGSLIVTKDTRNESETPADGISTPIDFEGLKKVVYPQ